jgi:chaperonin GroEL (HSP60 family)
LQIPSTLTSNCGMPVAETLSSLRAAHSLSGCCHVGIDAVACCVRDLSEEGPLEALAGKLAQISLAGEAATTVLRIDAVYRT